MLAHAINIADFYWWTVIHQQYHEPRMQYFCADTMFFSDVALPPFPIFCSISHFITLGLFRGPLQLDMTFLFGIFLCIFDYDNFVNIINIIFAFIHILSYISLLLSMRKPQYCTFRLMLFLHTYPSLLKFLPVLPHEELHPALAYSEFERSYLNFSVKV